VRIPEPEVGLARSPGSARGRSRSSRKCVADGRVYLASVYGSEPGGGVLLALSAASGELLWRFNTLLGPDSGVEAVGLGSGGVWETPLVRSDGSVRFGTGNPYQSVASAIAHPSAQLYTDSDMNLDAAAEKLRWYGA
jgi:outer membrane protein assembly factor BamB